MRNSFRGYDLAWDQLTSHPLQQELAPLKLTGTLPVHEGHVIAIPYGESACADAFGAGLQTPPLAFCIKAFAVHSLVAQSFS